MRTYWLAGACALAASASGRADAAPVDDVRLGGAMYLRHVTATHEGDAHTASSFAVPKAANTLDVDVRASDFGIPRADVVRLAGSAVGDHIAWTGSHAFVPPVDVGGGAVIERVDIMLIVRAEITPGDRPTFCGAGPCDYSAQLRGVPGSGVTVHGRSGPFTQSAFVPVDLDLAAGLPRPSLRSFSLLRPERFCRADRPRTVTVDVLLSTPAPSQGASFELYSSLPGQIWRREAVRPGAQRAAAPLTVPAGAEGVFQVTVTTGGVARTQSLRVAPPEDCAASPFMPPWFYYDRVLVEDLGCIACLERAAMNARGDVVVLGPDGPAYLPRGGGLVSLAGLFGPGDVGTLLLDDFGRLAGTRLGPQGAFEGFVTSSLDAPDLLELTALGAFAPRSVNAFGAVAGTLGGKPAFFNGNKLTQLDPGLAGAAEPVGFDNDGFLLLDVTGGQFAHRAAFFDRKKSAELLPGFAGQVVAASAHALGRAAGYTVDPKGKESAFLFDPLAGVEPLDAPPGFAGARAFAVNAAGWAVGDASDGQGKRRPVLFAPGLGALELPSLVDEADPVVVERAVAISDAGDLLVEGYLQGERGFLVLRPGVE